MFEWIKQLTDAADNKHEAVRLRAECESMRAELAMSRQAYRAQQEAHEAQISLYQKKHSKDMQELMDKLSDREFRVHQLENCASKHLYDSVCEKLLTVSSKLSDAESKLRDVTHERDEMQRFIDTLPDGLRGAWSLYLMTKKDEEGGEL